MTRGEWIRVGVPHRACYQNRPGAAIPNFAPMWGAPKLPRAPGPRPHRELVWKMPVLALVCMWFSCLIFRAPFTPLSRAVPEHGQAVPVPLAGPPKTLSQYRPPCRERLLERCVLPRVGPPEWSPSASTPHQQPPFPPPHVLGTSWHSGAPSLQQTLEAVCHSPPRVTKAGETGLRGEAIYFPATFANDAQTRGWNHVSLAAKLTSLTAPQTSQRQTDLPLGHCRPLRGTSRLFRSYPTPVFTSRSWLPPAPLRSPAPATGDLLVANPLPAS